MYKQIPKKGSGNKTILTFVPKIGYIDAPVCLGIQPLGGEEYNYQDNTSQDTLQVKSRCKVPSPLFSSHNIWTFSLFYFVKTFLATSHHLYFRLNVYTIFVFVKKSPNFILSLLLSSKGFERHSETFLFLSERFATNFHFSLLHSFLIIL